MKKIRLLLILIILLTVSTIMFVELVVSATSINSTSYSGSFTLGNTNGNITNGSYFGAGAAFYQQPVSNVNASSFSGQYSFTSQLYVATPVIINPKNETYITGINIPLNFTLDNNVNSIWYNLDGGSNTTITGNISFNTTNGIHTLNLYINNTEGETFRSKIFTVNTTKFLVDYTNFSGSAKGQSTNFNLSTFEELQNISDFILENVNYGKIKFNTNLNLTNDSNFSDNELDLDSYVQVGNNTISINSNVLPNLNKSANLYLYNLSFTNPRILKDGVSCPITICTKINYSVGTLVFNVTQFSNYTSEETTSESSTSTGGSGGGSGAVISEPVFTINKNQISISLTPGQIKKEEIVITNVGAQPIQVSLQNLFTDFVFEDESDSFTLNAHESKTIHLYINAKPDTLPELYLGKVIISSGSSRKEVLVAVEVESEGVLLDVRAEIQSEQKRILAGEQIITEIRLFNLGGDSERKDVFIEYSVRNSDNKEIVKESESLAIETQASFIKRINIPKDAEVGRYILYVKAIYGGGIASASDNFEIVSSRVTSREKLYIVIIIVLSIILTLIIYLTILHRRRRKEGRLFSKTSEGKVDLRSIIKK